VFDDDNLVSCAGLAPVMTLAEQAGVAELLAEKIHIAETRIKSAATLRRTSSTFGPPGRPHRAPCCLYPAIAMGRQMASLVTQQHPPP